tara:strand:+ start:112 stop:291 length:180 start_codon:yes stop_codon:yes gene_type:complete
VEFKNYLKSLVANSLEQLRETIRELYVNQDDEKSVNQQMIDNNYEYHGGTKKSLRLFLF